mgnify:CR=1 FL=1
MPDTAQGWIGHFALEPRPEGGYYRETYRSEESVSADVDEGYGLVGCTTALPFEFEDLELADCDALVERGPQYRGVIERLTR